MSTFGVQSMNFQIVLLKWLIRCYLFNQHRHLNSLQFKNWHEGLYVFNVDFVNLNMAMSRCHDFAISLQSLLLLFYISFMHPPTLLLFFPMNSLFCWIITHHGQFFSFWKQEKRYPSINSIPRFLNSVPLCWIDPIQKWLIDKNTKL